jgi:putative FmdB family regulatory protein
MPLYEYKCQKCHQVFEVIQKFVDAPVTVHENCGGAVEKLLSTSALQFKGSGFYINDYAKSGSKNGGKSKSESKSGSKSESKSETKTETKTEAPKTETKSSDKK